MPLFRFRLVTSAATSLNASRHFLCPFPGRTSHYRMNDELTNESLMKTALKVHLLIQTFLGIVASAQAQSTAFTYHGVLSFNRTAVTGLYDMQFALFGVEAGGAAVAGPLPKNAVPVTNGIFTTRLDFMNGVFTGPPRWIEISVRAAGNGNFQTLSPRQELTSSPYSIRSLTAADVANGSVVKSLNTLKDNVTLVEGQNVRIIPEGNTLRISSTGTGGPWSLNGANAYYNAGNVGIGTDNPQTTLDIRSPQHALTMTAFGPDVTFRDTGNGNARNVIQSVGGDLNFFTENYLNGTSQFSFLKLANNGNVGIGSANPVSRLEIVGQDALSLIGYQPLLTFQDANAGYARSRIQGVNGDIGLTTEAYISSGGATPWAGLLILKNGSGNVGIGTTSPSSKLEILAQDGLAITGFQPFLTLRDTGAGNARGIIASGSGDLGFYPNSSIGGSPAVIIKNNSGNVGIGTGNPQAKLDVAGTVRTAVLTITGGADIAEPFKMSSEEIPKGSAVVIDALNPGHLKLSTEAYDTHVAGVVSGANGIKPGISLHQEGAIEGGENVALSGRVYVQADASFGAIKPGDLLTTSDTPGHAMKVSDHVKAQGAILGKAMSELSEGKGVVLVLVTLQ